MFDKTGSRSSHFVDKNVPCVEPMSFRMNLSVFVMITYSESRIRYKVRRVKGTRTQTWKISGHGIAFYDIPLELRSIHRPIRSIACSEQCPSVSSLFLLYFNAACGKFEYKEKDLFFFPQFLLSHFVRPPAKTTSLSLGQYLLTHGLLRY